MSDKPKRIRGDDLHAALVAAGVLRDGELARRIVIDAETRKAVVIHVERYGDNRLLAVVQTLEGIEVREVERGAVGRCTSRMQGLDPERQPFWCELAPGHTGTHQATDDADVRWNDTAEETQS